jgi:SAM-dependent methyltransferase
MALNDYSDIWLSAFLDTRDAQQTHCEARFVASLVPYGSRVLDLACGYGRHSSVLAALDLQVFGLDHDARVLGRALRSCPVVQADMRHLPFAPETFDAVVSLWQSFGYFSDEENLTLLRNLLAIVRPGGILVLDLYNREFFEAAAGERHFVRSGVRVRETTSLTHDRLRVHLAYNGGLDFDDFEWQVFTPRTLTQVAAAAGWVVSGQYCDFDRSKSPQYGAPRVQHLLSRPGAAQQ